MDFIFLVDIVLNFLLEFVSEEKTRPVRDITKIATRYFKDTFVLDVLAIFPFYGMMEIINGPKLASQNEDYDYLRLCYLLKLLRLKKASELLASKFFSKIIKQFYNNRLQKTIEGF